MAVIAALAGCGEGGQRERQAAENNVAAALAQVEIRPGLWEMTSAIVSVSQIGLPHEIAERMKGPRRTVRHCITPVQAARNDANFLPAGGGGRCSDETFEMNSGRIAGTAICRDEAGAETRLRRAGRYAAERYEVRTEIETPGIGPGRVMTLVTRQSGRRVGDCPEEREERK
ncbi:MAG TPA: DUF3617 domain-containing protein [Allosphingosinicella sp.]|nr:DUF3617 domain-containing protein [Allosphingosinicella sp.]